MKHTIYAIFLIPFLFTEPYAQLANSCDLLLQHGITNITKYQSSDHAVAYKWHKYCGINFDSTSDTRVSRASVQIFGYGSGSSGYNSNEQRVKLSKWCDQNESFAASRSDLFEEAQILSESALSSWAQCINMAKKDININFLPAGEHSKFVHFEVDSTHDGTLKYLGLETRNYNCTERMVQTNNGVELNIKDQPEITQSNIQIDCERTKPNVVEKEGVGRITYEQAYISVNTSGPSLAVAFPMVVSEYFVTPPSTVIAFKGNRCPEGWSEFKDGSGRFIVGANDSYLLNQKGGRYDIPAGGDHTHGKQKINGSGFGDDHADNQFLTTTAGQHNHGGNNLPPYIALKFCIRG